MSTYLQWMNLHLQPSNFTTRIKYQISKVLVWIASLDALPTHSRSSSSDTNLMQSIMEHHQIFKIMLIQIQVLHQIEYNSKCNIWSPHIHQHILILEAFLLYPNHITITKYSQRYKTIILLDPYLIHEIWTIQIFFLSIACRRKQRVVQLWNL